MLYQQLMRGAWLVVPLALLFGGCATTRPLYYWGSYQEGVYKGFQGHDASPEEQIALLEADIQRARAENLPVPPGFHAQLGYLYAQLGKFDQVTKEFETEKALYPESAHYMNFLMRNFKRKAS